MKTVKEIMKDLYWYCANTRQVGHTTAMVKGAENTPGVVVIWGNNDQIRHLEEIYPDVKFVSMYDNDLLRGVHGPILMDNFALMALLCGTIRYIEDLEKDSALLSEIRDVLK